MADPDGYAVRLANAFWKPERGSDEEVVRKRIAGVRTAFFTANPGLEREDFQSKLASILLRKFPPSQKESTVFRPEFTPDTRKKKGKRRSIGDLLNDFKSSVEARAIDSFWVSRKSGELRPRPEKIAQALLAVFARAFVGPTGLVLREFSSGIGFVDVGISFSGTLHLVELKILTGMLTGPNQLAQYMKSEQRDSGWLLLMDVRAHQKKTSVPATLRFPSGLVRVIVVELNPTAPHLMPAVEKGKSAQRGGTTTRQSL
ncbi:MAG: hypothetical protein M3Z54_15130 [Gemmatimonadota bacterium]|nr:hypothetical protein [Gemmatimonadota bacterium]